MDFDFLHAARIGIEHFEFVYTWSGNQFAAHRYATDLRHKVAAKRIDILGRVADVESVSDDRDDIFKACACIRDKRAVGLLHDAVSKSAANAAA